MIIGLSATNSLAFGQDQAKYRVLKGWSISEQRRPQTLFEASELQFADRVFDPRANALLKASQAFTNAVFNFPDLGLKRAVTYRSESGDILLAEWSIEGFSAKGTVFLEDTPYLNLYKIRLDRRDIVSPEDLTAFLSDVLIGNEPPLRVAPGLMVFNLPTPPPGIIAFSGDFNLSEIEGMRNVYLAGAMTEKWWYLTVRIAKPFTTPYYPVRPFIPERFPPLTELMTSWSFERIWSEVGKPSSSELHIDLSDRRNALLIKELARRDLSADQFADLLADARPAKLYERARATLQALTEVNQTLDGTYFKSVLEKYERIGPAADDAVGVLFGYALRNCSPQFEALALKTLNNRLFPTGPLAYLGRCASSSEMLHAIEQVSVPDRSIHSKNSALEEIRKRLATSRQ